MNLPDFRAAARVLKPLEYAAERGGAILALCRVGDRVRAYPGGRWIIERADGSHWTGISGRILDTAFADLSLEAIEASLHRVAQDQPDAQDRPFAPDDAPAPVDHLRAEITALQDLLADWPTMRALSASGALRATAKKIEAREILSRMLAALKQDAGAA